MRTSVRVMLWVVPGLLVVGIGAAGWFVGRMTPYRRGLLEARPAAVVEYDPKSEAAERDALPWPDETATTTVSGTVLRRGATVAGARVRLFETIVPRRPYGEFAGDAGREVVTEAVPTRALREVATDSSGAWRIDGVSPGRYCIAAGPGDDPAAACSARVFIVPPGGVPIREDLALPDGTASVAVRVTGFDGRPFTGRVALRARPFLETADVLVVADCDDNGRAALSGLSLPTWSLWALCDDGAERGDDVTVSVVGEQQEAYAAMELAAGLRRIAVHCVAAEDGAPIRGAVVRVRDGIGERIVRAGDDGRAVTYAFWAADVDARAAGRAGWVREFDGAVAEEPIELRMPRTGVVEGTVVAERDDTPAAGAVVWAGDPGNPETPHARAAADGSFRIEGCAPGRVELRTLGGRWTHAAGGATFNEARSLERDETSAGLVNEFGSREGDAEVPRAEVVPGEVTAVRLHAERAARVVGRVVDESGRPVAGARIMLRDKTSDRFPYALSVVSGSDGRFTTSAVRQADAAYCAVWTQDRAPGLRAVIPLGDDGRLYPGATRAVTLTIPASRSAFATVVDAAGAPVPGAVVVLRFVDAATVKSAAAVAVTGADGRARFDGVPAAKSWFEADAGTAGGAGFVSVDLSSDRIATEQSPVLVALHPAVTYRGVVVAGSVPVEGAVVRVTAAARADVYGRSDERGEFAIVAPGHSHVSIAAFAPGGTADRRVAATSGATPSRTTVDVTPRPAAAEESAAPVAVVVGPAGEPVTDFRWRKRRFLDPDTRAAVAEIDVYAMRDAAGVLLPFAPATLRVPDDGATPQVRAERGDGAHVAGRVVDGAGTAVAGAVVAVFRASQRGALETTDAISVMHSSSDGAFAFRGLPSGALVIRAIDRRSGAVGSVPVPADGRRAGLTLAVSAEGGVSILVLDPFQRAMPGADVTIDFNGGAFACLVLQESSFSTSIVRRTGPDGIARFPEIPPTARCRQLAVTPRYPAGAGLNGFTELDWRAEDATITLH